MLGGNLAEFLGKEGWNFLEKDAFGLIGPFGCVLVSHV